jgi:hypothetical protein
VTTEVCSDLRVEVSRHLHRSLAERTGRRWLIVEPSERRPFTVNEARRAHRMRWATLVEETRGRWHLLAEDEAMPPLWRARITVLPLHRDLRSPQDVAACAPEAKAAIDGLVDAGVLVNDDAAHLISVTFLPPLRNCGTDGMALLIEEMS